MSRKYHVKIVLYWLKLTFFDRRPFDAIVLLHWRNETSPQYPNYDIKKDEIVDTLDLELVSNQIQPGIIEKVYNYFKSWI